MTFAEFIALIYADGVLDTDEIQEVHWSGQQGMHVLHTKRNDLDQVTITD